MAIKQFYRKFSDKKQLLLFLPHKFHSNPRAKALG
ncbi:hypothetical protein SGRA_0208 [Saprospira grandis str. Lewin]|uniref:Uncharacterized protein n=1 Tax=Saprospira grandis (strain Lewin) TaxID=984262 RepID=H6L648_SAPGL|nr:hypothetical protein SGRA_0208 [Saprospira grandis str. Lewin]